MPTLPELVPDLDAMLAMTPAELGPLLMRAVEGMRNNGKFHPSNLLDPTLLYGRGIPTGRPVYPGGREMEVERAVREGLQWLDQNGFTVAADANGWAMFTRKGEQLLRPGGANPGRMRRIEPRAVFATATGVNEIDPAPREAAQTTFRPSAILLTVGGQAYQISGLAWGTHPPWHFIQANGTPLTREQFLALPLAERQELGVHVQAYVTSLGGRARLDPIGLAPVAGPVTSGGALGSSAFNSSPFNTVAFNSSGRSGAVGGAPVGTYRVDGGPPSASTTPAFSTGYNEGEDEHRDAAGNVLTDGEVEGLLNVGDPIQDSAVVLPTDTVTFTVSSGPPPDIPEPGPALIEPEWVDGRLRLPKRLPTNDLWDEAVESLIAAVRAGFVSFIEELAGTNFSPAARRAIEGVPELLSATPDQARVFRMGHVVEHLEALQPVLDDELPDALQSQYRTLVGQFLRLVDRFPDWRALTLKAQAEPLTEEQAREAVPVARGLAAALSTSAAAEVADTEIAGALSGLADAAEAASGAERALLDFDLVASVVQVVTKLMRPVADCWAYCWREYGTRAWEELKKTPGEAGAGTVKLVKRIAYGVVAVAAVTGFFAAATQLATVYPALSWLPSLIAFLKFIATAAS